MYTAAGVRLLIISAQQPLLPGKYGYGVSHPAAQQTAQAAELQQEYNSMHWSEQELVNWLDERLPADQMVALETQLRADAQLRRQVSLLLQIRDQGGHSAGEIWQRAGLSCPDRDLLRQFQQQSLPPEHSDYIRFHLTTVGCRNCEANLRDLQSEDSAAEDNRRRRRLHQSSSQLLPGQHRKSKP